MVQLNSFGWIRHLRAEPTSWVMHQKDGRVRKKGRGLAFWFLPIGTSVAEIPLDDRELPFLFRTRSSDFQEVVLQGVITYRVITPEVLCDRVNFAVDMKSGAWLEAPLDKLGALLSQLAQERACAYLGGAPLSTLLGRPLDEIRGVIHTGLVEDETLNSMGLEVLATRVAALTPSPELERALQMPTREGIQQGADEATFRRRALAVEKERAIQENEMGNQIELARRAAELIEQEGQNAQRKATDEAEAERISSDAKARRRTVMADAEAHSTRVLEVEKVKAESARIDIYRDLSQGALMGLAAQELAKKLRVIEHLNVTPDLLGSLLSRVATAGAARLEEGGTTSNAPELGRRKP